MAQFVSILEKFGIPGPQHLRVPLETNSYWDFIGQGAQFSVYKWKESIFERGVVMKRV